jgi:predicted nucleic-acid-binding Zn-ribbon protein
MEESHKRCKASKGDWRLQEQTMSEFSNAQPSESVPKSFGSEKVEPQLTEKLARILQEKNVVVECPRCGSNEWYTDLLALPVLSYPVAGSQVSRPDVPVFFLTCRNCGWIALHSVKILEAEP